MSKIVAACPSAPSAWVAACLASSIILVDAVHAERRPAQAAKVLEDMNAGQQVGAANAPVNPAEEEQAKFVRVVLADTEDVWKDC